MDWVGHARDMATWLSGRVDAPNGVANTLDGCADEIDRLRAEIAKLRTMVDTMTQTNDEITALYEERGVEIEKLRADVVWVLRKDFRLVRQGCWQVELGYVEYDGTDSAMAADREGEA